MNRETSIHQLKGIKQKKNQREQKHENKKIQLLRKKRGGGTDEQGIDCIFDIYKQSRTKILSHIFIRKLKQITIRSEVPDSEHFKSLNEEHLNGNFLKPLTIFQSLEMLINILSILQFIIYLTVSTLALTFSQVNKSEYSRVIIICCFLIQLIQMLFKSLCQSQFKVQNEIQFQNLNELFNNYVHDEFLQDIIILFLLLMDSCSILQTIPWIRLIFLIKIKYWQDIISTLEITFISNCYKEQYWELAKVIIFNYAFAHMIGLVLIMIGQAQSGTNWLSENGFQNLFWVERYIWSYYWAINIMFTVGFGDISAVTSVEAAALIFIETLSCIVLAYNISKVGSIIKQIRSYDEGKEKNIKTFSRMKEKSQLSCQLKKKMRTFINQSINMKRNYNIEEEEKLLGSLPSSILEDYRKQTNTKILKEIPLFKLISNKYLNEISTIVEKKLAHPEQIIINTKKIPDILIVQGGEISLCCNVPGYKIHGKSMQTIKLKKDQFKLLSFNFLLNKLLNYDTKCHDYCVIYQINKEKFIEIISSSAYNHQYYCWMKDKDRYNPNEYGTISCCICGVKEKHSVFQCPQIHYIPLNQHIVNKFNKNIQQERKKTYQGQNIRQILPKIKMKPLHLYHTWKKQFQDNIDDQRSIFDETQGNNLDIFMQKLNNKGLRLSKETTGVKKTIKEYKSSYNTQTISMLEQIEKLMKTNIFFQWDLECDKAYNFQYYFPTFNPSQLKNK